MRAIPLITMLMLAGAAKSTTTVYDIAAIETITLQATKPTVAEVFVFTDTSCPYCALLHSRHKELLRNGIRIRYLFYPRKGPATAAFEQAVAVWCSQDRRAALDKALRGAVLPKTDCDNPVRQHYELARRLELLGTPAIITANGAVMYGVPSAAEILAASDT